MTRDVIHLGLNFARPSFPLRALKYFLSNTVLNTPLFFNDVQGQEKAVYLSTLPP